jgi:IS1 family transposase/transposase-like protein
MLDPVVLFTLPLLGFVGWFAVRHLWRQMRRWWIRWRSPVAGVRLAGLTQAPACTACATASAAAPAPRVPPPRLEQTRGRTRSVDTSSHFCPNPACGYYGWLGLGNLRANGHPNGGRWRQLECIACGKTFMETMNTIFYRKQVPAETIWRVLTVLAEGLGIRATARAFDLDPNTVLTWLQQAAAHMDTVSHYLIHDLHLTQIQLDELWALLGQRDQDEPGPPQRGTRWVWAGVDPVSKLLLATVVGDRSLATAQLLIHAIAVLLAPGCIPLFSSDQWAPYATALLTHFGHWVPVPRRGSRGRHPKPRWRPLPTLQYAQVVKQRAKGRVIGVSYRVVYGSLTTVTALLQRSGVGQVINTAFIERFNLTLRQHVAALGRKVTSLAQREAGLENQLALGGAYYNFCLPHRSLRLPLPEPQPTRGTGSPKQWQLRTPGMAAGVTDRVWRLEELLLWRVPPWRHTPYSAGDAVATA